MTAWLLLVSLDLLQPGILLAGEWAPAPGIKRELVDPEFARWVSQFERPGREVYDRRHAIVAATGVQAGMAVADIGAGTGLFTRIFADRVGERGRVYAVDISKVFIDNIMRISTGLEQWNVRGIVNSATGTGLPDRSVDLVFVCDTYHHLVQPRAMLLSIRRAMRPGASLVVIDFRKLPGVSTPWVMGHVRAGETEVIQEIESNGFRLVEQLDLLGSNYFLRFIADNS